LKQVLIISYFYPPCNLTAANRADAWAEHLINHDFYPVVLTRKWEKTIETLYDIEYPTSDGELIDENDKRKIHYLPQKSNLKARVANKFGVKRLMLVRKMMSFIELILQNVSLKFSNYNSFYEKADTILKENVNIKIVIITGNPFQLFNIGHSLKKKYPHIQWIADYRDEWTTRPNFENKLWISILNSYNQLFEKKWLKSAIFFTYPNSAYINRIESLTSKKGEVLINGFTQINSNYSPSIDKKEFLEITFSGTLYHHQNIEIFAQGFVSYMDKYPNSKLRLNFIGVSLNSGIEDKLKRLFNLHFDKLKVSSRVSTKDLEKITERTSAFIMFPIRNMPGVIPTKVFDYLTYHKPIIFCPSDGGEIDNLLTKTSLGIFLNTTDEVFNYLEKIDHDFKNNVLIEVKPNIAAISDYSRQGQVAILAKLLNDLDVN
jgi:glycosyltransferase involved in cell wall biosynthesis